MAAWVLFSAVVLVSLVGGLLPLALRATHARIQAYLSLSAGVMLGAAFFHMLPHAAQVVPASFGVWAAAGVVGLYFVQRFIAPHSHEAEHAHNLTHEHSASARDSGGRFGAHVGPISVSGRDHGLSVSAWTAFGGLSIHSVMDGLALAGACAHATEHWRLAFLVFLAVVVHKPADSLTISSLMIKTGTGRGTTVLAQVIFALLPVLGGLLFYAGTQLAGASMESTLTGAVLAASAGTFICIALGDLLPEVQFHSHDRLKLAVGVLAGLSIMLAASLFERLGGPHRHDDEPLASAQAEQELAPANASRTPS